jgi:hypothetical protein
MRTFEMSNESITKKQRIHISIGFGDVILPVIDCDDGEQRVPLKPIADEIGINWQTYSRRIDADDFLSGRLGLKMTPLKGGQKVQKCILLTRVEAFLYTLNPKMIRNNGKNEDAANWLEAKINEWDDAIHLYETNGFASKDDRAIRDKYALLSRLDRVSNVEIKRIYAENLNKDYGFDLPLGNQSTLDI